MRDEIENWPDRLITIKQVRALIGVSQSTIYEWIAKDQFPRALQLSPQVRRWWRGEILAWIAERSAGALPKGRE